MDAPTETQTDLTTRYSRWVVAQRWPLLILCVLLTLVAGSGMRFLAFDNDYRVFFGKDNPQLLAFEAVQRTYTKVDNILFAIIPDSGDAFSPKSWRQSKSSPPNPGSYPTRSASIRSATSNTPSPKKTI